MTGTHSVYTTQVLTIINAMCGGAGFDDLSGMFTVTRGIVAVHVVNEDDDESGVGDVGNSSDGGVWAVGHA